MLYMVIERFRDMVAVGARFQELGRLTPEGVICHAGWIGARSDCSFQIMECADRALLDEWMRRWADVADFEISEITASHKYWEPPRPATTIYEMVMSYPISSFGDATLIGDVRRNIAQALREALLDPS
jgi:hypothetical protein